MYFSQTNFMEGKHVYLWVLDAATETQNEGSVHEHSLYAGSVSSVGEILESFIFEYFVKFILQTCSRSLYD